MKKKISPVRCCKSNLRWGQANRQLRSASPLTIKYNNGRQLVAVRGNLRIIKCCQYFNLFTSQWRDAHSFLSTGQRMDFVDATSVLLDIRTSRNVLILTFW